VVAQVIQPQLVLLGALRCRRCLGARAESFPRPDSGRVGGVDRSGLAAAHSIESSQGCFVGFGQRVEVLLRGRDAHVTESFLDHL
jgi:hypothetical protein